MRRMRHGRRCRESARQRPWLEQLEDRRLLSAGQPPLAPPPFTRPPEPGPAEVRESDSEDRERADREEAEHPGLGSQVRAWVHDGLRGRDLAARIHEAQGEEQRPGGASPHSTARNDDREDYSDTERPETDRAEREQPEGDRLERGAPPRRDRVDPPNSQEGSSGGTAVGRSPGRRVETPVASAPEGEADVPDEESPRGPAAPRSGEEEGRSESQPAEAGTEQGAEVTTSADGAVGLAPRAILAPVLVTTDDEGIAPPRLADESPAAVSWLVATAVPGMEAAEATALALLSAVPGSAEEPLPREDSEQAPSDQEGQETATAAGVADADESVVGPGAAEEDRAGEPRESELIEEAPAGDLAAVEAGIRQFLDQLEDLAGDLVGSPAMASLLPWLVAGGSLAVACEIARRQVKRRRAALTAVTTPEADSDTWIPASSDSPSGNEP